MSSSPSMPSSLVNPTCPVNGRQVSIEVPEEQWPVDRPQTPATTWTSGHIGTFMPFQSPGWGRPLLPRGLETVVEVDAEVHQEPEEVQEEEVTKVTIEDLGPDEDHPDHIREIVEEAANNAVEEAGQLVQEEEAAAVVGAGFQFQLTNAGMEAMVAAGLASSELLTRRIIWRDK